jgi:hypothetical protein
MVAAFPATEPAWALRAYLVLIGCAADRQMVTYGALAKRVNRGGPNLLREPLDCITRWCTRHGLPPIGFFSCRTIYRHAGPRVHSGRSFRNINRTREGVDARLVFILPTYDRRISAKVNGSDEVWARAINLFIGRSASSSARLAAVMSISAPLNSSWPASSRTA